MEAAALWRGPALRRALRPCAMDPSTLVAAVIVVLSVLVMRMGLTATLGVIVLAFLLLCHPVVRVFFEMAVPGQGAAHDSTQHDHETSEALRSRAHGVAHGSRASTSGGRQAGRLDLATLPAALQPELRHLLRLVRADFVQFWFDPISFGSTAFPDEAMACVEHLLAQMALRLEQYSRATVVCRATNPGHGALPHGVIRACNGDAESPHRLYIAPGPVANDRESHPEPSGVGIDDAPAEFAACGKALAAGGGPAQRPICQAAVGPAAGAQRP